MIKATTPVRQPQATTKKKTPSQCFVQVEAPRRPSNREMRVLLDFVNDIYNSQGVDIYEGMHKFTNEIHTAWKNAREGSQFIFNIPYAGKQNLFLRRRKHSPNNSEGVVEARHCASNIYWVLKHK